jgi:hypothetical protein
MALLIYIGHSSIQIIVMLIGTKNEIETTGHHCPRLKILVITFPEGSTDLKP